MNIKILSWNVQGCAHPKFLPSARQYLRDVRPDLVVFVESRIRGRKADAIIASLGFPHSHRVEASGFSGGIWLAWFDSVTVAVEFNHFQFIHCRVTMIRDNSSVLATVVYGSPNATKRKALWSGLHHIAPSITSPWVLFGDFNATLCHADRMGGSLSSKPSTYFQNIVCDLGLRDMGFHGPDFTWQRGVTQVRLDRFLCNSLWDEAFPESSVEHLLRMKSDHKPILLTVGNIVRNSSPSPFRYFSGWSSHDDFDRMVSDNWVPSTSLSETIISFTKAADTWNKTIFGYIGSKKRLIMARLRGAQKALCTKASRFLMKLESELLLDLEKLLDQEELLWRQKSRTDWILLGDRNMRYFHRRAVCRKQRNRISSLQLLNGEWCSDNDTLRTEAVKYYESLFAADEEPIDDFPYKGMFPVLPSSVTQNLDDIPSVGLPWPLIFSAFVWQIWKR
ncbi:hypothetical protein V6N13_091014 [Hibiscus sabdariffa]